MSILKYKYKAHKLVNTLFYVAVFGIGFILGFGTNKIDFNKLVSQVLMIDNVKAYTITTTSSGEVINEDFIISKFSSSISDFDVNDYEFAYYKWSGQQYWTVYAIVKENIHLATQSSSNGTLGYGNVNCNIETGKPCYYLFNIRTSGSQAVSYVSSGGATIQYSNFDSLSQYNSDFTYDYSTKNVLDFSKYTVKLEFNENLFKDNPDFKEVCVPNNKKFAISTNNYELNENESSEYYGTKSFSSYEFLWFPYKIEGLSTYLYDNSKTDNVWVLEDDETYFEMNPGYWYWLNSKEEIDLYFNKEDPGNFLSSLGYENKYSYYGWYFHPFIVRYANSGLRQFNIFYFNDAAEVTKLDGSVSDNYEEYCFYIKNDFNVNILNTDEFGDQFGDITIMEDENLEVSTSQNVSSIDSKGLFAKVRLFLNKMSGTIDFVGDYIYELYESMPVILKLFIFSVFGLIVIKIIIGMVVK